GPWLNQVKQFFGFGLLAVAIWLLERVIPGPVSLALWAGLTAGIAVQLGLFDREPRSGTSRLAQTAALLFATYAAAALFGALAGNSDPLRPLHALGGSNATVSNNETSYFTKVTTADAVRQQLAQAKAAGQ